MAQETLSTTPGPFFSPQCQSSHCRCLHHCRPMVAVLGSLVLVLVVIMVFIVPLWSNLRHCPVPIWWVLVAIVAVVTVVAVVHCRCRRLSLLSSSLSSWRPGPLSVSVTPRFHPTSSCLWWRLEVLFVPALTPPSPIPVVIHPASRGSQRWWGCAINSVIL